MRICHTSDWHLGHALRDVARDREHAAFLAWLVDTLAAERCDALVVTGDVYDSSIPPASAEALWFGFLAAVRARLPELAIVAIAGNHDSPSRLGASAPLAEAVGVHVVTSLPRTADGALDAGRVVIDVGGALVIAIPYLRAGDLPHGVDAVTALRAIYAEAIAAARARRRPGQALVATGHLYLTGGQAAWLSERRVVLGGIEAIEADMFTDDLAYVALGHLHKAQRVGRDHVRYAGSPIPLAMDEAGNHQQVVIVDVAGDGGAAEIRAIPVPRLVEMIRIPRHGAAPIDDVLRELAALPARGGDDDPELRPYLEAVVALDQPDPRLRARIEEALDDRAVRLVKLAVERTGDGASLADRASGRALADLDPRDVLRERWRQRHGGELPDDVLAAFDRLVAEVRP
jgi:exonuclease SbcD